MIRRIEKKDEQIYLEMAKSFYSSGAVQHALPEKYFSDTFAELMRSDEYADGYILEYRGKTAGYALLAKTFSQEAGGSVLWIEELFVMPEFRCRGLGHEFFSYLKSHLCGNVKRIRLEAAGGNQKAISLYRSLGFLELPYSQMILDL